MCDRQMAQLSARDKVTTDIRIRCAITFLLIQAILAWCGSYSSAVVNLTPMLSWHTLIDGVIMVSTFALVTVFSRFASYFELLAWLLDGTILFLMFQAITKCFDIYQSKACFSTIPQDIITIVLMGLVILLDFMQYNALTDQTGYLELKAQPAVEQHILQRRARLLHIWSLPFAIGILVSDIVLAADQSTASALATPIYLHIILDPILSYTATQNEPAMLHVIGAFLSILLFFSDCANMYYSFDGVKMTTYLAYKEWCLYTLLAFDVFVIGVRVLIATYKPEVLDLVGSAANKAKWAVKRVVNPTPATKKKT